MKKYLLFIYFYALSFAVVWGQTNAPAEIAKERQQAGPVANRIPEPAEKSVTVFPNPSNGVVYVSLSGFKGKRTELRVINVIGNVVHREFLTDDETNKKIDLSKFASGLYYVKLQADDFSEIRKVILK
jgi:hypothetical protein